jgi:hypothetical protein
MSAAIACHERPVRAEMAPILDARRALSSLDNNPGPGLERVSGSDDRDETGHDGLRGERLISRQAGGAWGNN